ncbi:TPA: hypothetical protein DDW69_02060 [candidate division CPR2 bacterium]|uniref:Uncharacterized protein n=1 Tax=candidate division CPR2 bacterium GW2011_GWC1_41_48 TaxID=1618344 RepID=A0A0G0WA12_UNCC2|nr:MAG: hypothetical protein UT47_C0001G0215 [candidate division CPR2 bacterium GW2011_GWC2_39_35]KKR28098.1 MAG: hypothetical protein UT59_C0035G0008 [candidate division CPR2 bacterium GW2011_GWD1_39_7]KKR28132.1 MAG: hypothetical protein UT60_C0027G0022 [candidate division CPR2 bacterium GW2011_GWD2_39_7]KKS09810.1 MAG: hypothetical protein UU65_C0001G0215 [candidate division CPR2 bacterium GW2011_GWC1_41_48]OGB60294.1 MAG: hypothetical protein A2Y27_01495 [candidate division CPR2 bacterium G
MKDNQKRFFITSLLILVVIVASYFALKNATENQEKERQDREQFIEKMKKDIEKENREKAESSNLHSLKVL